MQDDVNAHCPNMINCRSFIMLKLIDQPTSHILCTPWMKILLNIFMKSPTDLFPKESHIQFVFESPLNFIAIICSEFYPWLVEVYVMPMKVCKLRIMSKK